MRSKQVALLAILLIAPLISCTAGTKAFTTPTSAMEPTLLKDEKFSADMNPFEAGRGDLVLFDHEGQLLLKRVIAVGGDVIEGRDLKVFLNGNLLDEPYIQHTAKRPLGMKTLETFGPIRVSVGMLFVAGDNRDYSFDSRDPKFGLVSRGDVRGRPIKVLQSTNPARNGKSLK